MRVGDGGVWRLVCSRRISFSTSLQFFESLFHLGFVSSVGWFVVRPIDSEVILIDPAVVAIVSVDVVVTVFELFG